MSNFNLKIDLMKLKNACVQEMQGKSSVKKCLIIPIDDADLFMGKKGIYLDLTAVETPNNSYGSSHFVRQNISKERYKAMTEDERNAIPILGNVKEIGSRDNKHEEMPKTYTYKVTAEGSEILPF